MRGRGHVTRPTEVVLLLAFVESDTNESGSSRIMRRRRSKIFEHRDLSDHRDNKLGEILLPTRENFSTEPLSGAKTSLEGAGFSRSAELPDAGPLVKVNKIK